MSLRAAVTATIWLLCADGAAAQAPQTATPPPAQAGATWTDIAAADPSGFERWSSGRYRLTASDVVELTFPYVPEFDQVVVVQPDGYITLRGVGEIRVQSRTIPELRQLLLEAYAPILRDPVVSITLKEFEKPYFIAAGQVKTPGKFDLRGATTVTQALAIAGGISDAAKHSQVILFRRYSQDLVEVKQVNVKRMLARRDLSEDLLLRPGDTLFVPKSMMSRLKPYLPVPGLYMNPLSW